MVKTVTQWELVEVGQVEWAQDESGVYTVINHLANGLVRVDVMTTDHDPVISFVGEVADVRKTLARWLQNNVSDVSLEHMAYIGAELARADLLKSDYIQD
jgi:hypothetical protein